MKRYRCALRRVVWLFVALCPLVASAQSLDVVAPIVKHVPGADEVDAGTPLTVSATVTDNVAVANVVLYYRARGENDYRTIRMRRLRSTNMYVATLPGEDVREPGVDYYFEAQDTSDNTRLIGYAFSPLRLSVAPARVPVETATAAAAVEDTAEKKKGGAGNWVWWVLGAGAIALVASGSSGGGGGSNGSIVIDGPLPE